MTERETAADIIARIREKAAEQPGFVYKAVELPTGDGESTYNTCAYFVPGAPGEICPSCIVGFGISPLLTPDDFGPMGFDREGSLSDEVLQWLANAGRIEVPSRREVRWIHQVQAMQDSGETSWGQAIAIADNLYALA